MDISDAVIVGVIVVVIIALLAFMLQRRGPDRLRPANGWHQRMAAVCASGRQVIDLTAAHDGVGPEHRLTADQLSEIESKLDLFLAQIRDAQPSTPGPNDARRLRLAALQAESLNEAIRTERRVRLKSARLTDEQFETLALQIASGRSALDDSLREISKGIGKEND